MATNVLVTLCQKILRVGVAEAERGRCEMFDGSYLPMEIRGVKDQLD